MSAVETAHAFACAGERLFGLISHPDQPGRWGAVIVVGGPQYRVGSHRQFVLLARALARDGIPTLRFDYRGMGDATGSRQPFTDIDADIRAAIDTLHAAYPNLDGVALWGLCDAASALCFYAAADARVRGLALANPWVRTEQGQSQAYVSHYYHQRLLSKSFWTKLFAGGINPVRAITEFFRHRARARTRRDEGALPDRMRQGLERYAGPILIMLSGDDLVAAEFKALIGTDPGWMTLARRCEIHAVPEATHTFSSSVWRDEVAHQTRDWIRRLGVQ